MRVLSTRSIDADDLCGGVVTHVVRDGAGLAQVHGASIVSDLASARALIGSLPDAVTELHARRLAGSEAERAAILADLGTVAPVRRR